MRRVFESFVTNFYETNKNEHTYEIVPQKKYNWFNIEADDYSRKYLPKMQPDIILKSKQKTIILDTKYYGKNLKKITEVRK